jgi:hypothetical protein
MSTIRGIVLEIQSGGVSSSWYSGEGSVWRKKRTQEHIKI